MKYAFEPLVSLSVYHTYFSGGAFGGFTVEPAGSTSREMLNHGLLLKRYNNGFHILFDRNFNGNLRKREDVLNNGTLCRFVLRLNDKGFYNYTRTEEGDISRSIYYFRNTLKDGKGLRNTLHTGKYVGAKDLFPLDSFEDRHFVKPFAIVDLKLSEDLEPVYSISFQAKETYWRYILLGDELKSLNSPAVIDSSSAEFFEGPEKLKVRGKDSLAFISKNPISFSQDNRHIFQLVDNYDSGSGRYKVVMRALPSANPDHFTVIDSDIKSSNLNYSEIFIH